MAVVITRIVSLSVLAALASCPISGQTPATLANKYLKPASITKLDWLLLRAQVESFTLPLRWDNHGLINSVSLFPAHPARGLVGMTFTVNKETYIGLSDDITRKTFADVVLEVCSILKNTIPEVDKGANVYANFVVIGGGIIAEYKNGSVSLTK
jgi:hypothetical protein